MSMTTNRKKYSKVVCVTLVLVNFTLNRKMPKNELLIIRSDFNAKVARRRSGNHIVPHELGVRNACGENSFAGENDLVIMNTLGWYKGIETAVKWQKLIREWI